MQQQEDTNLLHRAIIQRLESLAGAGLEQIPRRHVSAAEESACDPLPSPLAETPAAGQSSQLT